MKTILQLCLLMLSCVLVAQENLKALADLAGNPQLFDRNTLFEQRDASGKPYLKFFNDDHMMMSIYTLKGIKMANPHIQLKKFTMC